VVRRLSPNTGSSSHLTPRLAAVVGVYCTSRPPPRTRTAN